MEGMAQSLGLLTDSVTGKDYDSEAVKERISVSPTDHLCVTTHVLEAIVIRRAMPGNAGDLAVV